MLKLNRGLEDLAAVAEYWEEQIMFKNINNYLRQTINSLKQHTRKLKNEVYVIYLASKDSRTPWYTKLLAVAIVAYAFSPIDLIPDFIPILGYLDDLILLPLGILIVIKLIPPNVLAEYREKAEAIKSQAKPKNWIAAGVIVTLWFLSGILVILWLGKFFKR